MENSIDFLESKRKSKRKCLEEAREKLKELKEEGHICTIGPFYSTYNKDGSTGNQKLVGYTLFYD